MIGIDPEYFLDQMSIDELIAIYRAKYESDKQSWEQTRLICFYNVVSNNGTKNFKKPSDLFPLAWDKKQTSKEARKQVK